MQYMIFHYFHYFLGFYRQFSTTPASHKILQQSMFLQHAIVLKKS